MTGVSMCGILTQCYSVLELLGAAFKIPGYCVFSSLERRNLLSTVFCPPGSGDIFGTREQAGEGNRQLLFLRADNLREKQPQADILTSL